MVNLWFRIDINGKYFIVLLTCKLSFSSSLAWTSEGFDRHLKRIRRDELSSPYGKDVVKRIKYHLEKYVDVQNKHMLVIGSAIPWVETILLYLNASRITTLEYDPYPSTHPKVTTITPSDFAKLVLSNNAPLFDAMVSFSSLEHSGLGR